MRYPVNLQPLRRLLRGELETVEFYKSLIIKYADNPEVGTLFFVTNNHKKVVSLILGLMEKYDPKMDVKSLAHKPPVFHELKHPLNHPETASHLFEVENARIWAVNQSFLDPVMAAEWRKVLIEHVLPLLKNNQLAVQQLTGRGTGPEAEPQASA